MPEHFFMFILLILYANLGQNLNFLAYLTLGLLSQNALEKCLEMLLESVFVAQRIDSKCGFVYHSEIFLDPFYPAKCLCGKTWDAFKSKVYLTKKLFPISPLFEWKL